MIIDIQIFNNTIAKYDKREKRNNFFILAKKLINAGFETEGQLLILATWNFAGFRYAEKNFDVEQFKVTFSGLKQNFDNLSEQNFQTINFNKYKNDIQEIYTTLSEIKGVEYTGAPKLMHLKNPNVFVMWDTYIRGEKSKKIYDQLEAIKNGTYQYKKYSKYSDGYIDFLQDMQDKFKKLNFINDEKTLAKAVDEFNYVNITLPLQEIEKQIRNNKKQKKTT